MKADAAKADAATWTPAPAYRVGDVVRARRYPNSRSGRRKRSADRQAMQIEELKKHAMRGVVAADLTAADLRYLVLRLQRGERMGDVLDQIVSERRASIEKSMLFSCGACRKKHAF